MKTISFYSNDPFDSWEFTGKSYKDVEQQVIQAMFDYDEFRTLVDWKTNISMDGVELTVKEANALIDYYNSVFDEELKDYHAQEAHIESMRRHSKLH
ncbi:MAG: hypothetical protein MI745_14170 [Pseudomonadales bacterium]|nr:hypothetical protein [Pseudomonadales bacterium]